MDKKIIIKNLEIMISGTGITLNGQGTFQSGISLDWFNTNYCNISNNGLTVASDGNGSNSFNERNPYSEIISGNNDFLIEFEIPYKDIFVGVAQNSKNANNQLDIDFCIKTELVGIQYVFYIFQNGSFAAFSVQSAFAGKICKIESVSGLIKYYIDNSLVYTSAVTAPNTSYKIKSCIVEGNTTNFFNVISF